MSGYNSQREVREVTVATLRMEGRDPADYSIAGIMRDAFYARGAGYGYGAAPEAEWRRAVQQHNRRAGAVVATAGTSEVMLNGAGFYARCTKCPEISGEIVAAKHRARMWAAAHACKNA